MARFNGGYGRMEEHSTARIYSRQLKNQSIWMRRSYVKEHAANNARNNV